MNYLWTKTCLLFVQLLDKQEGMYNYLREVHNDINDTAPYAIIKASKKVVAEDFTPQKFITHALLFLNPRDRSCIISYWLERMEMTNKKEVDYIRGYLDMVTEHESSTSYYTPRIYKYSLRIDEAIYNKRYSLALKLSNRCLKEYYYLYLKGKKQLYKYSYYKKDARLLYQHMIDYLNPSSKEEQEELLSIALFTNSLSSAADEVKEGKSTPDKYTISYFKKGMTHIMNYFKD